MVLSDISIRNPVFAWMLMAGLILFGFICFTRMGLSQMPDVDFPVVNVSITLPNAAPEVVESDVADPVESAVLGVEGVQDVQTTCTQGQASISVFLDLSRNVDSAVQDVQTLVFQAEKQLPTNVFPPVIKKFNPNSSPIIWFAVTADSPHTIRDLMLYTRDHIQDKFTSLEGVSTVNLGGFMNREINVWVDNHKLNARQLTSLDILNTIQHQHQETPAGYLETPDVQYDIRMMGEAYTVPDFANLPILARGGTPNYALTRLRDVASIEDGIVTPMTRISRFNGTTCVGLGVVMQDGYNAVDVGDAAKKRMAEVVKQLPQGYHMAVNFDTTTFVRDNVHELELTIMLAAILTSLVCFVFLGSWSSTLNVFLAIPTSLFGTFIITYFFGFTLNTFTLMALSLSIGVVVDDAIMVLENIVRHQEKGEDMVDAALTGAREITFAAMATSIAIVAIFLPIAFMTGIIGKFFFQFGITISGAVLISLLEAITLTPMRCAEFVHKADEHSAFNHFVNTKFNGLIDWYKDTLNWALSHRWKIVIISFAVFFLSLFSAKFVKKEFVPSTDMGVFIINLKFPVQYSLDHTDGLVKQCEDALKSRGEVKNLYVAVGGFGGSSPNSGVIFITMKNPGDRPVVRPSEKAKPNGPWAWLTAIYEHIVPQRLTQAEFASYCRTTLSKISPDLRVSIQDLSMRGWSTGKGYAAELLVTGPDWDVLTDAVQKIRAKMKTDAKLADTDDNFLDGQPEIRVIPDRVKAAQMGVNMDDLGNVIAATIGGYQFQGIYFHEGGHDNPIAVRVPVDERKGPDAIKSIYVRNNRGEVLPISAVASLKVVPALQQITRDNRQRAVFFYANPAPGTSQQECLTEAISICKSVLPDGYSVQLTGSSQANANSFQQLGLVMLLGIAVAYMVLGSQFNSFIHPVTILLALPFSVTGALFSLLATGQALSIYSAIGIILLMGLVKKNSIMLVDFTNQRRAEGMNVHDALLSACPMRLRAILMTSFATIAGAIPAALALGPGAELRQPMSIAIIGGILFSTVLTLVVVPCAYSLMSTLEVHKAHHVTGYEQYTKQAKTKSSKKSKAKK
jgi:HAE1 family hydrophobic/amphiphilic exporter-1